MGGGGNEGGTGCGGRGGGLQGREPVVWGWGGVGGAIIFKKRF